MEGDSRPLVEEGVRRPAAEASRMLEAAAWRLQEAEALRQTAGARTDREGGR